MTEHEAPSWLSEQCPPWCVRPHQEDDHPEDRFHQSEEAIVPVVLAPSGALVQAPMASAELTLRIGRHLDEAVTWVDVSPTEGRSPALVLSRDSARALARSLLSLTGDN